MHLTVFLVCLASFLLLAAATSRQQDVLFRRKLTARLTRAARMAGWCGLAIALAWCVTSRGWAFGLASFSGHTSIASGVVYVAMIARGRRA